ncbi:hypothetical protein ACH4F6_29205 [Streptomyces sp. NPDC017936]|uniref:hypothetical protein n=1 Tax=Streptomyces sp. NPDC017936 TaxID=3365016 RepID=UPI0037B6F246
MTEPVERLAPARAESVAQAVASWKAAVLDLFGGGWSFAWVGPRDHQDWHRDVASVMALRVSDPRGWYSVDFAPESAESRGGAAAPFLPWSSEQLTASLFEVGPLSAAQLLVALKGEWYQAANIPDFENRKDELLRSSRRILSRFGPDASFFTNASEARNNPDADLLNPAAEWECLSDFTTDCGLVAVSATEVGVFWAFWED